MRDVAKSAGVSLKTVSRVVNGEGGVTAPLEQRVRAAVRTLGYQPDDRARYLRRAAPSTRTIGYIQMDVANPFFSSLYRGLEDVATENGYLVLAGSSDADPEREAALVQAFVARRVDGLVIASNRPDHDVLRAEIEHGTAVVFVDHDPALDFVDVVRTDHYGGAATATRHLIAGGHARIAFLGDDPMYFSAAERRRAFVDTMAEAGLATPWLLTAMTDPSESERAVTELLAAADRPTALFTAQNFVTIGAIAAIHRLGLQHQIAVVGFDDLDIAEWVDPKITVVPQQPTELGKLAAERLFQRLAGHQPAPTRTIVEPRLIARGSGEIPPPAYRGRG